MEQVILCVDDEEMILKSLESQLRRQFGDKYVYEFAQNGADALELLDELDDGGDKVLLIVSDWLMPGIKGDEFLIKAHKKFPNIKKVILTGQADEDAIKRAEEEADLHRCVQKPWKVEELVEAISTGLEEQEQ